MSTELECRDAADADKLASGSSDTTPKAVKKLCEHCGSEDVGNEAAVHWNVAAQCWEVTTIYDNGAFCAACDGETRLRDEPTEPVPSTTTKQEVSS